MVRSGSTICYRGEILGRSEIEPGFCQDPSGFKFWDGVHPGSKMHCIYAAQFLADLRENHYLKGYEKAEGIARCRSL
jgi:phospholipase/lecithinase/hemolysin